jgi:O-antigen/teichoic acid export membrane protein
VPVVVGASVAPTLTNLYDVSEVDYAKRLQDVFSAVTFVALCVGAFTAVLSKPLIDLIFGDAYSSAALILAIHVWTGLFIAHVSIRTRALLIEGKTKLILLFSGLTLVANILLNLVLIERFAGAGAACASLISWGLSTLLFPLAFPQSRRFAWMLLQSFVPASWVRVLTAQSK